MLTNTSHSFKVGPGPRGRLWQLLQQVVYRPNGFSCEVKALRENSNSYSQTTGMEFIDNKISYVLSNTCLSNPFHSSTRRPAMCNTHSRPSTAAMCMAVECSPGAATDMTVKYCITPQNTEIRLSKNELGLENYLGYQCTKFDENRWKIVPAIVDEREQFRYSGSRSPRMRTD